MIALPIHQIACHHLGHVLGFSPPSAVTRPQRVNVVPHTHWDREWYRPFQTFRLRLVDLLDDLLADLEADPALRPLPARRADGGGRRLPRGAARARGRAAGAPAASGRLAMGPWYIADGRVPRLGRDARARPAARAATGPPSFGGAMARRLPARHVRPRRPDAAAARRSSASTTPSCGGACLGAIDRTGVLVGGARRLHRAGRVPADRATATAPAARTTPRRSSPGIDALVELDRATSCATTRSSG